MKICPRCQKTYADDNLNFCLEDGSVLNQYGSAEAPETVMMNEPRITQPQPQAEPGWSVAPQQQQPYSVQPPKKSSKAWVWVLLILGAVVLLCGGGIVGVIFWAANRVDNAEMFPASNSRATNTGSKSTNSSTSTSFTPGRDDLQTLDLSRWVQEFSVYSVTEFKDGEFVISAKKNGFYNVVVALPQYTTQLADTRVTVRNINNASGNFGYGLVFHSNPQPLQQDYAFAIDTKRKRYRVVRHAPKEEMVVLNWTNSNAIKAGSEPNVLEARDFEDRIDLYINGTMVTSIKNLYGYAGGVPGIYTGDAIKIAFKDLEIRK